MVHVVLPNKAKHYLASLNLKTKTDAVDARGLAQFGVERKFAPWQPPRAVYRKFKELTRHRTNLQDTKTALMNQLSSFSCKAQGEQFITKSLTALIQQVSRQVVECEVELKRLIESDEELKRKMSCLTSITGVGLVSAAVIVAETGGFEQFKSIKQLVSFAGMDVVQRQSGTSVKGKTRISKKGNAHIRRAIYFPAVAAIRHSDTFKTIYARHLGNEKPKMVALVAIQRKLLALMFTLWKNETHFIENYQQTKTHKIAPAEAEATQDSLS